MPSETRFPPRHSPSPTDAQPASRGVPAESGTSPGRLAQALDIIREKCPAALGRYEACSTGLGVVAANGRQGTLGKGTVHANVCGSSSAVFFSPCGNTGSPTKCTPVAGSTQEGVKATARFFFPAHFDIGKICIFFCRLFLRFFPPAIQCFLLRNSF